MYTPTGSYHQESESFEMARTIIPERVANINIAETVFEEVEMRMPDNSEELDAVMRLVHAAVGWDLFRDLEIAVNMTIGQAMEDGFHIGWEMRGKV